MAPNDRPTINLADLQGIIDQETRKTRGRADDDELQERAIAALGTLRGLSYADKQKVIRRMARMIRP